MLELANRLATATSPYLRGAAHQPVHWFPWGDEAFRHAAELDRPILLDIGATWCHWCHVMDRESYEDPDLARFLNEHFVCIKVDRDERPDVDARYQRAVQAITGQGGWPLTGFLLPDGHLFYGGTYFPPEGKYARPGFRTVLAEVLRVYRTQRDRVAHQALALGRALAEHLDESAPGEPGPGLLAHATEQIARLFDARHGGFGTQPKFPHPAALTFLLARLLDTRDPALRPLVERTLLGMASGGIHDQLGGGFHRYSVDARWIVPHFEKMSYDNAELLKAYLDGYAAFGTPGYAETARGIVRWVREVLADPAGGYGASQDADVGLHDDGDYYTWTLEEAAAVLSPAELEVAAAYFDIGTAGEMDHNPSRNVLYVAEPIERIAGRLGQDLGEAARRLTQAITKLRNARARRPAPAVDRTRYTNWNGMLAGAMIRAGSVLDDPWALAHGLATLRRIRREAADPAALPHSPGGVTGLLDDQVQVAAAALDAYEATGDLSWLDWSAALLDRVWQEYRDPAGGGLFDTALHRSGEGLLPTRAKPVQDAPTPSPNGVAALASARLAELTGDVKWRERSAELVGAFAGRAAELGLFAATMLLAVDWAVNPPTHLVIVEGTEPGQAGRADALHRQALRTFAPRRVVHRIAPGTSDPSRLPPAVRGMLATGGAARAYLCVGATCRAPADEEQAWAALLGELRP
ncbi:MAG TPA: thioredoxin domain-containing protein [Gemmatimonadales bacterium]|nr:thioredoxin domain-containing protein [Gemmatimonadales bacterium]